MSVSRRSWWRTKRFLVPTGVFGGLLVLGAIIGDPNKDATESETTPVATESATLPVLLVATTLEATTSTAVEQTTSQAEITSTTELADVVDAISRLQTLIVADPDPNRAPYIRDEYEPGGWADFNGDCITTRHDILIRLSLVAVTMSPDGCRVATGEWVDAYTGDILTDADDATIDHFLPLAAAHRAGAWRWDNDTKVRLANDDALGALVVVGSSTNQSKADQTPDKWLPPRQESNCWYAVNWVDKKTRWSLTVTQAEHDTLAELLDGCSPDTDPGVAATDLAVVVTTTAPPVMTTTTLTAPVGPGEVVLVSCHARAEEVVISNPGGQAASLSGYTLHDDGNKHSVSLSQWGPIQPGTSLTIVSGDSAAGPGRVLWTGQNVWNNDGDTAYLVAADGTTETAVCSLSQ